MKEVVIASACRTAIGAFGGTLKSLNGAVLASVTMAEAVKRAGIDSSLIEDMEMLFSSKIDALFLEHYSNPPFLILFPSWERNP